MRPRPGPRMRRPAGGGRPRPPPPPKPGRPPPRPPLSSPGMSIGVIGLGYVGLPPALAFAEAGEDVVAVDVDPRKVAAIAAGDSYIEDVPPEALRAVLPRLEPTSHYQPLAR